MTANWSCPDGELVLSVEDAQDRDRWLAERRKGIGSSDIATLMGEGKYTTDYDIWLEKTGRSAGQDQTLQMEMGARMEAAIAEKFANDYNLEIRRRGMLRSKTCPQALANIDRLSSDGWIVECKSVNGFTKLPTDLKTRHGIPGHWWWQLAMLLFVSGREGAWLVVGIGNHDFQVRFVRRDDPDMAEAIAAIPQVVPQWWFDHVVADEPPSYAGLPDLSEVLEGAKYEALIPSLLLETRDRLREIRETRKALKDEEDDVKAKIMAEAGGAEWLLASGVPVLHLNPTKGRSSFQKAKLFARQPLDGLLLAEWAGYDSLGDLLVGLGADKDPLPEQAFLTEQQFTSTGKPGTSLLIVGKDDEDDSSN